MVRFLLTILVKFSSLRFHRASTTVIHETYLKTTVFKAGNISTMLFVRDYSVGILKTIFPKFFLLFSIYTST